MKKEELIKKISNISELNPDEYDGSYELMREIVASYSRINDYSKCDYRDLNAIYIMAIGTWKINIQKKKEYVKDSHLSSDEKNRINAVIDKIWDDACYGKYKHKGKDKPIVGMFGTGFYSFYNKTTDECVQKFIKMIVEIANITDDVEIYRRAQLVLTDSFKGMKAASASVVLHCLKPFSFPILNRNQEKGNIYSFLGISLSRPSDIDTYIDNCRLIKEYRDQNFSFKNYRVFDLESYNLDFDISTDDFWPSYEEYPVNISKDDWLRFLKEVEYPSHKGCMRVLMCYKDIGGVASPKKMSEIYKGNPIVYTSSISNTSRRALKYFDMRPCEDNKNEGKTWMFPIAFQGREEEYYVYRMRPELMNALEEINITDIELEYKLDASMYDWANEKNIVLYGPPGTGKTYNSVNYAVAICEGKSYEDVVAEDYEDILKRFKELQDKGRIAFTTFHQSYGYEEFIEGIKPLVDENGNITYKIVDGIFKRFCDEAMLCDKEDLSKPYVFIIDEINRGNISKIFGELITLIENTKRKNGTEEMSASLPYSHTEFSVPQNVYLLGTMNTADRSIALMDTALRRRFSFVEMMPDSSTLDKLGITFVVDGDNKLNVSKMLDVINKRIEYLYDREHTIGHAFFMRLKDNPSLDTLSTIFKKSIIPLLQEYFYEDYAKIQYVLGDNNKEDSLKFILDEPLDVKDVFNGMPDIDFPDKRYRIQEKAFDNIMSYKNIGKGI